MAKKNNNIIASGKRKTAVARATIKPGTGLVRINNVMIDNYTPKLARLRVREPLLLASEYTDKINIDVSVRGGGVTSQADAIRTAIAKALNAFAGKDKLKEIFLNYDRTLLVSDTRRKEVTKPNCRGKARSKVQKSYR